MKRRKLLTEATLRNIHHDVLRGVPLARAMSNANLTTMSRPSVAMLLKAYQTFLVLASDSQASIQLSNSLFPECLKEDGQEIPMQYNGLFPFGEWAE